MPPDSFPLTAEDWSPRLQLPYLAAGQAQKHVTVNEAITLLDGLIQTAVESAATAAEPAAPPEGSLHILPEGRAGPEWGLHPVGALLRYADGGWTRLTAGDGAIAYVKDAGALLVRMGGAWRPMGQALGPLQNLSRLGLGTEADAANPLSAKLNKALFTARGAGEGGDGDLRLTFSKETAPDVLSLLFQTSFAARAEIGLVGDDKLRVRVSPDGVLFRDAIVADPSGRVGVGLAAPDSRLTVGANPPLAAAMGAVGAAGGLSLALSDNVHCSLYVRHPPGGVVLGTDPGGALRLAAGGSTDAEVKLTLHATGAVQAPAVYADTTPAAANLAIDSAGVLRRSASAARYKTAVEPWSAGEAFDRLRPVSFAAAADPDGPRYVGLIAEEVEAAGLDVFVERGADKQPEGVAYAAMAAMLIGEVQALRRRVERLESGTLLP